MNLSLSKDEVQHRWIHAQKLDTAEPFGKGPLATKLAIEHLGYVQIDTINVIERSHHHILYTRIPKYSREDLHAAQTLEKSVFEYWTHALAYVPTRDYRFFMQDMKEMKKDPPSWYGSVKKEDHRKVIRLLKKEGPISIRDIEDDVLVEKDHPWASKKPSKRALQLGFYTGDFVVSERIGMLKQYDLAERHFGWGKTIPKPKAATRKEVLEYLLERALRSQAVVSLDSICHLEPKKTKVEIRKLIDSKVKMRELTAVSIPGAEKILHWIKTEDLEKQSGEENNLVHLLSPFDPLVIQRKRLELFFGYEHRFEAYLPKEKRKFGYFALPVLLGKDIVAAIDLKTDREVRKLKIQKWSWIGKSKSAENKKRIEEELHRFEKFQLFR